MSRVVDDRDSDTWTDLSLSSDRDASSPSQQAPRKPVKQDTASVDECCPRPRPRPRRFARQLLFNSGMYHLSSCHCSRRRRELTYMLSCRAGSRIHERI